MEDHANKPAMLDYAQRKSRLELLVDLGIGVVGVVIIFPVSGLIAFEATRLAGSIWGRLYFLAIAFAGVGAGVWCIKTAILGWLKRNAIPRPVTVRVESLRWRWIVPGLEVVLCLTYFGDPRTGVFGRGFWITVAVLSAATFMQELSVHFRSARAGRRTR